MKHFRLLSFLTAFAFNASAQNVGIGTTIPSDQLHTTGTVRFENYKGSNTRVVQMDASGRLVVAGPVSLNSTAQAIPDDGCAAGNGISSAINITGQPNAVSSSKIAVRINITHSWDEDLRIYLYPPTGSGVLVLASANGGSGDNFTNTVFTDQATASINTGTAPFTGQYKPNGGATACFASGTPLATFGAFGSGTIIPNGAWTLVIRDAFTGDVGTLNNWSISFTGPESFTSADATDYIAKFSAGNLVASNIYQQPFGNGNIGINTANPTANLEIKGTMKIDYAFPTPLMELTNGTGNGIVVSSPLSFAVRGTTSSGTGVYASAGAGKAVDAYSASGTAGEFTTNTGVALRTTGSTELNGNLSIFNTSPAGNALLHVDLVNSTTKGFLVKGTYNPASTVPNLNAGSRMMFYPGKAAFRAGYVTANYWDNINVGSYSTAMGYNTTARGDYSTAMGKETFAVEPGSTAMGNTTTASGISSTAMGNTTTASGTNSTAMGFNTTASGHYSTAMGNNASTNGYDGSFVYGDNSSAIYYANSTAANQFMVRAAGGTIFYSNINLSAGVTLAPGGGSWASISDINRKENLRETNAEDILQKVSALPITNWNYKAQPRNVRHIGPMAQDFYAAFHLDGQSDTTINTLDIDGVNMAAIQALKTRTDELKDQNAMLNKKVAEIDELKKENEKLQTQFNQLAEENTSLKQNSSTQTEKLSTQSNDILLLKNEMEQIKTLLKKQNP